MLSQQGHRARPDRRGRKATTERLDPKALQVRKATSALRVQRDLKVRRAIPVARWGRKVRLVQMEVMVLPVPKVLPGK